MRLSLAGSSFRQAVLCGLLLCLVASEAAAQQPSKAQADAIRQSCRADYQSRCAGVPTGGSAALQCLQQHLADLSPPCRTAVGAAAGGGAAPPPASPSQTKPRPAMSLREEAALMRRDCGEDFRAYCSGVRLGGGRGVACLADNEQRLSPSCKGALAEARAGR
jgi:cysteine rich repeat protein